jgi:hypothetical protein
MPAHLRHEQDDVYRLELTDRLSSAELNAVGKQLLAGMEQSPAGTVRLLVVLQPQFAGWDAGSNWSDLTFYVRHGEAISRIAIVGDEQWRDHALMFSAAGLRRAPVEYFTTGAIDAARQWIRE